MSKSSNIATRLQSELIGQIIYTLSSAMIVVVLTRLLTSEEYGLFYLTLSIFSIVGIFAKLGIDKSAAKYITEYKNTNEGQIRNVIKFSFGSFLFLISISSIAILIFSEHVAYFLGEPELIPLLSIGVMFLIFSAATGFARKTLQAFENIKYASILNGIVGLGKLAFSAVFVLLGLGALGALLGYITATIVATIFGFIIVYKFHYINYPASIPIETDLRRRIIEYSIPLTGSKAADKLDKEIDTILVGFFLNPTAVGYYVISKQIIEFIQVPINAVGFTLSPTFGSEKANDRIDNAQIIYQRAIGNILLLYIPAATGLIIIADPLVRLIFGEEYIGAIPVLQTLGVYAILLAVAKPTSHGLDYLGRAKERSIAKGLTSVLNFILNLIFIPMIGVSGAAVATVITFSIYTLSIFYIINKEFSVKIGYLIHILINVTFVSIIMGGAVYILLNYVANLITLIGVVLIGVVIWLVLSVSIGILDIEKVVDELPIVKW